MGLRDVLRGPEKFGVLFLSPWDHFRPDPFWLERHVSVAFVLPVLPQLNTKARLALSIIIEPAPRSLLISTVYLAAGYRVKLVRQTALSKLLGQRPWSFPSSFDDEGSFS